MLPPPGFLISSSFFFLFTYRWFCGFTSYVISELWAWDLETWRPITSAFVTFFLEGWGQCWHCIIAVWALSKFSPRSLAESHSPAEWLWHMREERGQWSGLAMWQWSGLLGFRSGSLLPALKAFLSSGHGHGTYRQCSPAPLVITTFPSTSMMPALPSLPSPTQDLQNSSVAST